MNMQSPATADKASPFVLRSLDVMAGKGFDVPSLLAMQSQALRAASQIVQRRHSGGWKTTAADLQTIVERQITGPDYKGPGGEMSALHVKGYMEFKANAQTMAPAQILRDADAISKMEFDESVYGKTPELQKINWLAKHLATLKQYVNTIDQKTPVFAAKMRERIAEIEDQVQDKEGLKLALSVIREVAEEHRSIHGQDPSAYTHLENDDEDEGEGNSNKL
jgi:hypothetical protein